MNQTVTANIAGIVFHIEVQAYEKLKAYLEAVRKHFGNEEEREEIMADIEARIAELFQQFLNETKEVITEKEVDEVMERMGQPEDYSDGEEEPIAEEQTASTAKRKKAKRFYRDPDNKVIAGVASGVGNYFGIDPVWIRLVWFLLVFFTGIGFLLYFILWIIIPKAETAAQKLEMKGEPITISNIGKTVKDDIYSDADKPGMKKTKDGLERIATFLGDVFRGFFKVFGKVFGLAIMIAGFAMLFGVFTVMFASPTLHIDNEIYIESFEALKGAFFQTQDDLAFLYLGIGLIISIPALALIYGGILLLSGRKNPVKGIGIIFFVLWLIGLGVMIVAGNDVGEHFQSRSKTVETIGFSPDRDHVALDLLSNDAFSGILDRGDSPREIFPVRVADDSIFFAVPRLDVVHSSGDSIYIEIEKYCSGIGRKEAKDGAEAIQYNYAVMDSLVRFSPHYATPVANKIRMQEVKITVFLPEGKSVFFGHDMHRIIYDVENVSNTYDGHMTGESWIMLDEGLTCINCEGEEGISSAEVEALRANETLQDTVITEDL